MYRHAVVCIDFQAVEAARLLERAASLLGSGGRLSAISVIEVGSFESDADSVAALVEEEFNTRSAHLARLCREAGHPEAEQRVLVGKAAREIVAYVQQGECDLAVMGEHEGARDPRPLGSTADATLRLLHCDALVVRTRRP